MGLMHEVNLISMKLIKVASFGRDGVQIHPAHNVISWQQMIHKPNTSPSFNVERLQNLRISSSRTMNTPTIRPASRLNGIAQKLSKLSPSSGKVHIPGHPLHLTFSRGLHVKKQSGVELSNSSHIKVLT